MISFYGELFCASLLFICDRIMKYVLWHTEYATYLPIDYGLLTVVSEKNYGFSFSILNSKNASYFWLFAHTASFVASFVLCRITFKQIELQKKIIAGIFLTTAGACSNLVDRLWYGAVLDYIAISPQFFAFPIFNIADVAIVIGWFLLCVALWRIE